MVRSFKDCATPIVVKVRSAIKAVKVRPVISSRNPTVYLARCIHTATNAARMQLAEKSWRVFERVRWNEEQAAEQSRVQQAQIAADTTRIGDCRRVAHFVDAIGRHFEIVGLACVENHAV